MNNSPFHAVYSTDGMSEAHKLLSSLEQAGHITSVENVINQMTSTVIVTFADGRVTRIVYEQSILDRVLGRTI